MIITRDEIRELLRTRDRVAAEVFEVGCPPLHRDQLMAAILEGDGDDDDD